MSEGLPSYPFDPQRCIGTVCEVGPNYAKVNLPNAAKPEGQWLHGNRLDAGQVGEFVVVECGDLAVFGRLITVRLPEKERLSVEPGLGSLREAHPVGTIQLLTTISLRDGDVMGGIPQYPRLGSRVYSAHPQLMKWLAEAGGRRSSGPNPLVLNMATLPASTETSVSFTPENLFGRHCAVLGATGGGKSWTVARIIEQAALLNAKVILLDATGEFHRLAEGVQHVHIGDDPHKAPSDSKEVVVPYSQLVEADLLALFKPSGQSQVPKFRAAMKSLKLAKVANKDGIVVKAYQKKVSYEKAWKEHASVVESSHTDFDIKKLARQIDEECVWPTGFSGQSSDPSAWGKMDDQQRSWCVGLITRIEDILSSSELACVLQTQGKQSLFERIDAFLDASEQRVLRVSMKHVSFAHNAREIVANAIGRYLLGLGRRGRFREKPAFVFLDEAHQFLNKTLGDENTKYPLDSFELIAKEGRKFSLNICIATQRPRDIPDAVISQMGTLIVHRLTNDKDREVVERASGDIDRSAAAFLPTLAPGQAVIIGVDFPIPLTVQISKPHREPDSRGPDYQSHWRSTKEANPDPPGDSLKLPAPREQAPPLEVEVRPKKLAKPQGELWAKVLEAVGRASPFTRTYLLEGTGNFSDGTLTIYFEPEFEDHLSLVNNERNTKLLQKVLSDLGCGAGCKIAFAKLEGHE
jgi:hypothetical protein